MKMFGRMDLHIKLASELSKLITTVSGTVTLEVY
jgi:hypothetical protein